MIHLYSVFIIVITAIIILININTASLIVYIRKFTNGKTSHLYIILLQVRQASHINTGACLIIMIILFGISSFLILNGWPQLLERCMALSSG